MVNGIIFHTAFDMLAVLLAILSGWLVYRWKFQQALPQTTAKIGRGYFLFLSMGSITGAYIFGTLNLYVSGVPEVGRSILGAVFGATFMVELYKLRRGTSGSTGYVYIIPFTVSVIIGRIGCFLSGIHDHTHGIETNLPWGWDYDDQVLRHPVQLYESLSMVVFLLLTIVTLKCCHNVIVRYGFYMCVGFYAAQRFVWEFFKPYGDVIPPLNVFQVLCLVILLYSAFMVLRVRNDSSAA